MFEVDKGRSRTKGGYWHRLRLQLSGCLLLAVGLPYLVGQAVIPKFSEALQTHQAVAGSIVAIFIGTWLFRSLSTFPGIKASSYILPSFALSYSLVLFVFFLGRLEYNRIILFAGFIASVLWFYVVYFMIPRQRDLRIGVVPFGGVDMLRSVGRIEWIPIASASSEVGELDAIVADLRVDLPDEWERRLADHALSGVPVYHVKQLHESLTGRVELEHLSENSFGSLTPTYAYLKIKNIVDWLAAVVAILVAAPFLALVAIAIRIDSSGPAVFRQRRVGCRGIPFTVYKFRTMMVEQPSREEARAFAQTQPNDQRVTRLGRFLRRSRIDELPQIVNILKGEMSWIGPRPEAEILSNWYEAEIPFYRYRHIVRPGITGWAQVNQGHVADVAEVQSKLHYDFYYIKSFSPWIDILIVGRTLRTMLTGFGSR